MILRPSMTLSLLALATLFAAAPASAQSTAKPAPTTTATAAAPVANPAPAAAAAGSSNVTPVTVVTTAGGPAVPSDIYMWVKMCSPDEKTKKEVCTTTQRLLSNTGEHVVTATIREVTGDPKSRQLMVSGPLGMQLEPGLKAFVDKGKVLSMRYALCFTDGCYAQGAADDALMKLMKSGTALNIAMVGPQGQPVTVPLSLANFAKVYGSKGVDPATAKLQFDILAQATIAKAKATGAPAAAATKVN